MLSSTVVNTVMISLTEHFRMYNNNIFYMQLASSIPSLGVAVFSLILAFFGEKLDKIAVTLIGILIFVVSGMYGYFMHTPFDFIASRVCLGIGSALMFFGAFNIAKTIYSEKQQKTFFSINSAMTSIAGALSVTMAASIMTKYNWQCAFLLYSISLLAVPGVLFYLAKIYDKTIHTHHKHLQSIRSDWIGFVLVAISILAITMTLSILGMNAGFILTQKLIYTNKNIGLFLSVPQVGVVLGSFVAAAVINKFSFLKMHVLAILMILFGMVYIYFSSTMIGIVSGSILLGFGTGVEFAILTPWLLSTVKESIRARVISVATALFYFGFFIASPVLQLLRRSLNANEMLLFLMSFLTILLIIKLTLQKHVKRV